MDYGPGSTWRHYLARVYGSSKANLNIEDVDVLLPDKGAPRPPPLPEGKSYAACPKSDDEPFRAPELARSPRFGLLTQIHGRRSADGPLRQ